MTGGSQQSRTTAVIRIVGLAAWCVMVACSDGADLVARPNVDRPAVDASASSFDAAKDHPMDTGPTRADADGPDDEDMQLPDTGTGGIDTSGQDGDQVERMAQPTDGSDGSPNDSADADARDGAGGDGGAGDATSGDAADADGSQVVDSLCVRLCERSAELACRGITEDMCRMNCKATLARPCAAEYRVLQTCFLDVKDLKWMCVDKRVQADAEKCRDESQAYGDCRTRL